VSRIIIFLLGKEFECAKNFVFLSGVMYSAVVVLDLQLEIVGSVSRLCVQLCAGGSTMLLNSIIWYQRKLGYSKLAWLLHLQLYLVAEELKVSGHPVGNIHSLEGFTFFTQLMLLLNLLTLLK